MLLKCGCEEEWERLAGWINEQILGFMNEKRSLVKTIRDRKTNWIGDDVRRDCLMKLMLEARMEGKRPRGRPRMGMIDDLLDESYGEMKRKAENRENRRILKLRTST